jgi:tripartite-type tricarboxylate transporter receptor subunit TctC
MVQIFGVWRATGVSRLEDTRTKEIVVGAVGRGNASYSFPMILKELYGAKLKIITGYRGGSDVNIALERGEVGGRVTTLSSWKVTHPSWFANDLISVLAYAGPRAKGLSGIPSLEEAVPTNEDRLVVRLLMSGAALGRPLAAPPGVPKERVAAMRVAFQQTMSDPLFLKDAGLSNVDIDPVSGHDMRRVVGDALRTPAALRARARRLLE